MFVFPFLQKEISGSGGLAPNLGKIDPALSMASLRLDGPEKPLEGH